MAALHCWLWIFEGLRTEREGLGVNLQELHQDGAHLVGLDRRGESETFFLDEKTLGWELEQIKGGTGSKKQRSREGKKRKRNAKSREGSQTKFGREKNELIFR